MNMLKPQIATEKHCNALWSGSKKNFRCYVCGHKFKVGDTWRFVPVYEQKPLKYRGIPNFLVCQSCDGEDEEITKALYERVQEAKKLWWLFRD